MELTKKRYKYDKFLKDIFLYEYGDIYYSKDNNKYVKCKNGYFYKLDKRYSDYYPELAYPSNDYNWEEQEEFDENWAELKKYMKENKDWAERS